MRQVVLDTETTGLSPKQGHRIIEIGCVEIIKRRLTGAHYHVYINPQREVDRGAMAVHGITNEFLKDKPLFEEITQEFFEFVAGSELIIHNAPFDVGFINHEFSLLSSRSRKIEHHTEITDTLVMARKKHPGQANSLDALCRRYGVDGSKREFHGALLDAQLLADVYLAMTGGQTALFSNASQSDQELGQESLATSVVHRQKKLTLIEPSSTELERHQAFMDKILAQ